MDYDNAVLPWTQAGWLEQVSAWIHTELDHLGIAITGPIEQPHVRPWSTVLRVPTSRGDYYFKANMPALAHEPALTQALARWRPDVMPQSVATDVAQGWMLMPDAGRTVRSHIHADRDLSHWHKILPLYAELQIEMVTRTLKLITLGAFDRRLAVLPAQYARLLDDTTAMRIGLPDGLTATQYNRLRDLTPHFARMCEELAAFAIPETLHHDDFHDGNIFVSDGRYIFYDWAESCATHPFFTMVVGLRSIAYRFELEEGSPELSRLRDIYLEPWSHYGSRADLLAAFDLAQRVGTVCRALTWYHVVSHLAEADRSEHAEAVPGWLQEFLNVESAAAG